MSTSPIELTDISLHQIIGQEETPVLIDLWAPWCNPCKTLGPTVEKLARKSQNKVLIAKIDVEKYPEIMKEFGVRGIPTLLLFKNKSEISRQLGIQSLGKLEEWLNKFNIDLTGSPVVEHTESLDWPTFYADKQLLEFFRQRLLGHAENKQLTASSLNAFWDNNQGTTSAAFVHSNDPVIFERMTGLPIAVARLLDCCDIQNRQHVSALFTALAEGKDYRLVPHKFINIWLSENSIPWTAYTQDEELKSIIEKWRDALGQRLEGKTLSDEIWSSLKQLAKDKLADYSQQQKGPEISLLTLISTLSPLPDTRDNDAWLTIAGCISFAKFQHIQIQLGWTPAERELPDLRMAWFQEKEENSATGTLTQEDIRLLREEWVAAHSDFIAREEYFHQHVDELLQPYNENLQKILFRVMHDAENY
ncbi:thioredoxin [Sodalis sp. RH16]|uniref:thioredoxin n=1 Tax=Sodalis sp. RH16 TaxID=3394331 RepID=UPI0039B6C46C